MKKYSNGETGGTPPSCTNDYWVFDATNCTNNATSALYVANTTTSGTTFATTGNLCIPFNSKFQSQLSYIWTIDDIISRYVNRRQCNSNTQSYD